MRAQDISNLELCFNEMTGILAWYLIQPYLQVEK
jgi:hypothetical protein